MSHRKRISVLKTEAFFEERAKGSGRAKFERAMRKVRKAQPAPHDRLPKKKGK